MTLREIKSTLSDRLQALEERVQAACRRASRRRDSVTVVAVTKYVTPEVARLLPDLGFLDLGESRPQELWRKAAVLPKQVRWHLIGHLQRNKVEQSLPLVSLIHSVDSDRLLKTLDMEAFKLGTPADVLLEVNLSREPSKHGFPASAVPEIFRELVPFLPHVHVFGLMTMAPLSHNPEHARPVFRELRQLAEQIAKTNQDVGRQGIPELSMGMTLDFEVAIQEGATLIRVGSALFEGLSESPP